MPRLCPDCRKPLSRLSFSGLPISTCAQCGGVWFETGGLRGLVRLGPAALSMVERQGRAGAAVAPARAAERLCPNCETPLLVCHYGHASTVVLDTCEACRGVWVEEGELERIREWLASCALEPLAAQPRLAPSALVA